MEDIKFNDEFLQKVYLESNDTINKQKEKLNKISYDIKTLETVLSQIPFAFSSVKLGMLDEYIYWCVNSKRICFTKDPSLSGKPLIECKAEIRLAASAFLGELLKKAIKEK